MENAIAHPILSQKMGNRSSNMTSLTSDFVALVSNVFLLSAIMKNFERTLMMFLLLQNYVESERDE